MYDPSGYIRSSGTSFAAPHVAGAAALYWAKNQTTTYQDVKNAILASGDPVKSLANKTVSGRRLNINSLLSGKFNAIRALTIGAATSDAGNTVQIPISFANDRTPPVVGMQFDINFNPGSLSFGSPVQGGAVTGGHGLIGFPVGSGILRIVATPDVTNAALGSGTLATLPVTILPAAATGVGQEWLAVSNVVMSDNGAHDTPPGALADGIINVNTGSPGTTNPDVDRDGMSDTWELRFGLNPLFSGDALQDPDGDGRNNLTEFRDGTNPFVFDSSPNPSLEHSYAWTHTHGGTGADYLTWSDRATAAVSDDGGDIFIAGTFDAPIDFDGNGSTADNVVPLSVDSFVTKLDRNHQPIWTRVIHGTGGDLVNTIAVDNNGDVYLTGSVTSSVDIDGDGVVDLQNTDGKSWAYVTRINADGSVAWGRTFRVESGNVGARSMVVKNGSVVLGGDLAGRVDFNPTGTSDIKEFLGSNFSQSAAFVTTLDAANGAYRKTVLIKPEVNGGVAVSGGIAVDAAGNLYLTGSFFGSADFNPADVDPVTGLPLVDMKVAKGTDLFVTKFSPTDNYVWTTAFGASQMQSMPHAAPVVDAQGNVYVTGDATDVSAFGSGPADDSVVTRGTKKSGIFLTKLDASGAHVFTRTLASEGDSFDSGRSLSIDTLGNLYLVAEFAGTSKFFPDEKTNITIAPGSGDVGVVRFTADGNFDRNWTITGGTNTSQGIFGPSVAGYVDLKDNFYLVGAFNSTVDFNPALAADAKTPKGSYDLFISKYLATGSLAPANVAPMAGNSQVTAAAGATLASAFVASDIDGNSLTFTLASVGTLGTATLNDAKTGAFTFVAKPGVSGVDKLTFTVNDGALNSSTGTVVVHVGDATADPIATSIAVNPVTANLVQGQTLSFVATVNDQYGNPMTTAPIVWSATGGAISAGGVYGATVAGGPHTITASSGDLSANATVTVRANVAPTGSVAPITLALGQSFTGQVLAVDGDGDPVQFSLIVDAAIGHAVVNAATGSFTYTSNGTQSGADSFVIGVSDGFAPATPVTVVVHVTSATDTDGDGMADAWEIANFGNLTHDNATDSDLDGVIDLQEFINGTNPLIANNGKTIPDHGYAWTRTDGGSQYEYAMRSAVDAAGNVYVTGYYQGTVDFDPTTGVDNRTSQDGFVNAFVTKLNKDGSYAWTWTPTQQNTTSWVGGVDVAVDAAGNVYATGSVSGSVAFDAQNTSHFTVSGSAPTEGKIWLAKLAANDGHITGLQIIGNATSGGRGTGVEVDPTGAVYLAGYFGGSAVFDPSGVEGALSAGQAVTDRFAVFITRFNANGSYAWTRFAKSIDGTAGAYAYGIAAKADAVVVTGQFFGTLDFDNIAGNGHDITSIRQQGYDGFVAEWGAGGQAMRNRQYHGTTNTANIWPRDVAYDTNGDIYVTGSFKEQADFDTASVGGDKRAPQQTTNEYHGFVTKWSAAGGYGWTNTFGNVLVDGSSYSSQGAAVVVKNSRVYVGGAYSGATDFDPTVGVDTRSSRDAFSPMIASYDTAGVYIGTWTPVGAYGDFYGANPVNNGGFVYGLAAANDRVYAAGNYIGALNFNPTGIADVRTSTAFVTGGASDDVFVTALTIPVTMAANEFAHDSFTDTAGTALTAHNGELGATWSVLLGRNGGFVVDGNALRHSDTVEGWYVASGTPANSGSFDVQATVRQVGAALKTNVGVIADASTSTSANLYIAQYDGNGSTPGWALWKSVNATWTQLGKVAATLTPGQSYQLKLEIRPGSQRLLVDGVALVTAADTSVGAPSRAGTYVEVAASSSSQGLFLDDFVASNPASSTPVLTTIAVTPSSTSIQNGQTQTFSASAKDQFGAAITAPITWSVSGGGTITSAGVFTASTVGGPFTVTATSGSVSGSASVTVTTATPVLTTITVTPSSSSIQNGQTQTFSASAKDQFGAAITTPITWSVSGGGTITSAGVFTANAVGGPFTVTATSGSVSGSASVTVTTATPVLTSITVTPSSTSIQNGQTQTFSASAKDQFGVAITAPMTWSVSGGGAITSAGVFTANTVGGPFAVMATSGSVSGTASITVTNATPVLTTITLTPSSAALQTGETQIFTATAKDQLGNPMAVSFLWSVSGGGTIDANGAFKATTAGGPYTVTASSGSVSGTANVTVLASGEFVHDSFTDSTGKALISHVGEFGASWSTLLGRAGGFVVDGNALRHSDTLEGWYIASGAPTNNGSFDVQATVRQVGAALKTNVGVIADASTSTSANLYIAQYDGNGSTPGWALWKSVNATWTQLGKVAATLTPGQSYQLKLEIRPGSQRLLVDGVALVTAADTSVGAPSRAGTYVEVAASSSTQGLFLDDFVANNPAP